MIEKLRADKKRQAKRIADLAANVMEEKKTSRLAFVLMDHIEKRANKAEDEMKLLQSDLVAAKECAAETLAQAKKEHEAELREAEQLHRQELKKSVRADRRFSRRKADEKLQQARDEKDMVETNLKIALNVYKSKAKEDRNSRFLILIGWGNSSEPN